MAKKKSAAPDVPASRSTTKPAARPRPGNGGARTEPSHEEIAEAAYHRYLSRRGTQGSDFDDWVQAERDLRSRAKPKSQ